MTGLAVDDAAWAGRWRRRAVGDKAVLSVGLVLAALLLPAWPGAVLVAVGALATAVLGARVPARLMARTLRAPLVFLAIGAITVAVSVSREHGLTVTADSSRRALELFGHGIAGTLALLLLATTTPMVDLLTALRRWRVPDALIEVASLTYRLLFVLLTTVATIREAQANRLGYDGWRTSFRSTGALTAATLVRSWHRARALEEGLAGRGYESAMVTLAPPLRHSPRFVAASLALVALVVVASVLVAGVSS